MEVRAAQATAMVNVKNRPWRVQLDQQHDQRDERRNREHEYGCCRNIETSLSP
jgi:hypothetical protein